MSAPTRVLLASAIALLVIAGVGAAPPPGQAELEQMLRDEPMNLANWSKWAPRLREWSGEHFEAAAPAFQAAFAFMKAQAAGPKNRRPGNVLPRQMDRDAVAWMVLAGSFLHDGKPSAGPVQVAKWAGDAAKKSIANDKALARSHYYVSWAIQQEQLTPADKGGPSRPDVRRLQDAVKELQEAIALGPGTKWMPMADAGGLALRALKWEDAEAYFQAALREKPGDLALTQGLARAITEQGRRGEPFAAAVGPLAQQFPNDGTLAAYHARALLNDNRRDEAVAELDRARKLGTDPATVIDPNRARDLDQYKANRDKDADARRKEEERQKAESLKRQLEEERRRQIEEARIRAANAPGPWSTILWWAFWFSVIYGVIMGLMCLTGVILAKRTHGKYTAQLKEAPPKELSASGQVARTQDEMRLGKFYAIALISALVLFYLALPFLFIGLLIVFLIVLALAFYMRRGTGGADMHSMLLKASGGGITAIFKAMFARTGSGTFGLLKDRDDCPKLWAAIDEVAKRVDTEPPDELWISPGADFGVWQEGRGPFGVFGGRKRALVLGLCCMDFLTVSELKAILAHEFAHYSHADTHWNRFLFQVTLSLRTAMREMARTGGMLTYGNPFYWFFYLYSKSYSLLSAGFSRSREFLADRMACSKYGADVFARGLRKVCTNGSHFEMTVYHNIIRLLKQKKAYVNMYLAFRKFRDEGMSQEELKKLHKKLLADKPSMYASHPTFQERMDAARHLPRAAKTNDVSSLKLFDKPEEVEAELTDFLTQAVANAMSL